MAQSFFQKYGFTEVAKGEYISMLLKEFEEVENPNWLQGSFEPKLQEGKIVVSIFQNDRCPTIWRNAEVVRRVAEEFKEYVVINEYDTNRRENIVKYKEVLCYLCKQEMCCRWTAIERGGRQKSI